MEIKSLAELESLAGEVVKKLEPSNKAIVLALQGDLGAGKTTFSQFLAKSLGVEQSIISPTFVLMKRYPLVDQKFENLFHVDAYRLDNAEDLEKLNFKEVLADPNNLVVIEWPERVLDIIPSDAQKLKFTFIDETTREVAYV